MLPDQLSLFWYWMNERHRIYVKSKVNKEPWPWTEDKAFLRYKFCNVFRELDAVTMWLRKNWREPYADHERLPFNMCVARQFNWPPTLDMLGFSANDTAGMGVKGVWNPDEVAADLKYWRDKDPQSNGKLFGAAYMITGTIRDEDGNVPSDKVDQIVYLVLDPLWVDGDKYLPRKGDTLQEAHARLMEATGFGTFLSYEVVTDLRHTPVLRDAPDIYTWANPSPGSCRGINRLRGLPVKPYKQQPLEQYVEDMRQLLKESTNHLRDHVYQYSPHPVEMRTIEHSLCEFDKYVRVTSGQGRLKRYYPPQV